MEVIVVLSVFILEKWCGSYTHHLYLAGTYIEQWPEALKLPRIIVFATAFQIPGMFLTDGRPCGYGIVLSMDSFERAQ